MTPQEKAVALVEDIGQTSCPAIERELSDAAYTLSEGYGWPDSVDSVSVEQIIMCWRLVEYLRVRVKLPDQFRL